MCSGNAPIESLNSNFTNYSESPAIEQEQPSHSLPSHGKLFRGVRIGRARESSSRISGCFHRMRFLSGSSLSTTAINNKNSSTTNKTIKRPISEIEKVISILTEPNMDTDGFTKHHLDSGSPALSVMKSAFRENALQSGRLYSTWNEFRPSAVYDQIKKVLEENNFPGKDVLFFAAPVFRSSFDKINTAHIDDHNPSSGLLEYPPFATHSPTGMPFDKVDSKLSDEVERFRQSINDTKAGDLKVYNFWALLGRRSGSMSSRKSTESHFLAFSLQPDLQSQLHFIYLNPERVNASEWTTVATSPSDYLLFDTANTAHCAIDCGLSGRHSIDIRFIVIDR